MAILVLNAGSSTLKFRLYGAPRHGAGELIAAGMVSGFGASANYRWSIGSNQGEERLAVPDHGSAARLVIDWLRTRRLEDLEAIGHRVVHGGDEFVAPVRITDTVLRAIEALNPLAPLHNPAALEVMRATAESVGPDVPMVAVFDTAFHHDLPEHARAYALPAAWTGPHRIRRYGFHGIAHRYLYERCVALAGSAQARRVITLQLGNGCSMAAIRDGRSVDTSMGYTPLEGLVMSSRCGDVDPGALTHLLAHGIRPEALDRGLNRESGLLALSGLTSDMRELLRREAEGHAGARLAVDAFCYRARKYIGAYAAALGGVDAIVFGGGIGEHAAEIRARICAQMDWCGIAIDADANRAAVGREARISPPGGVGVYVVPVNEEGLIADDVRKTLKL
jgi:acetate kinase